MTLSIATLYVVLVLAIAPFFAMLLLVTAAALIRRISERQAVYSGSAPSRFIFVIPANDEEGTIRSTVESCRAVDYDRARFVVYVIADNCTDGTAPAARSAGAEVMERTDPVNRSKGHALEYFFERGPLSDFDAVVIIDADSIAAPDILTEFAAGIAEGWDWIQCYDTASNADASWRTRLMAHAFSLVNGVWLLGQEQLGVGAALRGNGMCFTTQGLSRVPWRVHGLAEDLEFSWALRIAGERIHFEPGASVLAEMLTRGGEAATVQRRRWEVGRRSLRTKFLGPLLNSRRVGLYTKVMYLIELFFPPLVGLLLALMSAASVHLWPTFDSRLLPLSRALLPIHGAMAAILVCYALSPVFVMHLPARYLTSLFALPYYAVWKIAAALGRKPTAWVRTRREPSLQESGGP